MRKITYAVKDALKPLPQSFSVMSISYQIIKGFKLRRFCSI